VSNPRVWLYPVNIVHGKKEAGLVAFSREFLQEAVAKRIYEDPAFNHMAGGGQWLQSKLPVEIETVLKRHKLRAGFAVLAGVSRPVWVLPQTEIKLAKGKSVRPQPVEVLEGI